MTRLEPTWTAAPAASPLDLAAKAEAKAAGSAEEQVTALFELWRLRIYRYAIALGASPAVGEEVVQDSFLRLYQELAGGRKVEAPAHWLFRVARNLLVDQARSAARETALEVFSFAELCENRMDPAPSPEQAVLARERLEKLHDSLKQLTPHQRECIYLRAAGFRHREIAGIMGLGISTVADLLRRAIARLAKGTAI